MNASVRGPRPRLLVLGLLALAFLVAVPPVQAAPRSDDAAPAVAQAYPYGNYPYGNYPYGNYPYGNYPYGNYPYANNYRPTITSVSFPDLSGYAQPGQTVRVLMLGTPGGSAYLDVLNVQNRIAMTEVAPGRYEGSFFVQVPQGDRDDYRRNLRVRANLALNGRRVSKTARLPINIAYGYPAAGYPYGYGGSYPYTGAYPPGSAYAGQVFINVTSPTSGQVVGRDFNVTGQTIPYGQVQVNVQSRAAVIPGLINIGTGRFTAAGQADANGYFNVPVRLSNSSVLGNLGGSNNSLDLRVIATDPRSAASRQVQFTIGTSP